MEFNLPKNSLVEKFIPKNKFFSKTIINTKLKDEFTSKISKITWKYKLSPETLSIPKSNNIEEVQIFEVELKEKVIPKNVLKIIDKLIPYPILYYFKFEDSEAFWITLKWEENWKYYFSLWDEKIEFNFHAINLEIVYQNIIKSFIKDIKVANNDFKEIIENDKQISILKTEIQALKNKIKSEKQFNKKVEFNKLLQEKQKILESLCNT